MDRCGPKETQHTEGITVTTTAEYNRFSRQYQRSKELPFRVYSEMPDHLELIGDVRGLDVLDLACGEGFYTGRIKAAGAARAEGVDLSSAMVELARDQEAHEPRGIVYHISPAEAFRSAKSLKVTFLGKQLSTVIPN